MPTLQTISKEKMLSALILNSFYQNIEPEREPGRNFKHKGL